MEAKGELTAKIFLTPLCARLTILEQSKENQLKPEPICTSVYNIFTTTDAL